MSLLANRQPQAKTRPVSGRCRWVLPIGEVGTGVLAINGQSYTVTVLRGQNGIVGYRLGKEDGTTYDLSTTEAHWTCDCPDATFHPERPGGCKHVVALRAALKAAGQQ
jgi:hypothetical protein